MSIDSLKSLLNDFDPGSLIPSVESLTSHLPGIIRFAVVVGPLVLLIFGLIYLFFAPKEANYSLGFRSFWGMASVESWQFTQFVAGVVWTVLGFILRLWAKSSFADVADLEVTELLFKAISAIVDEIIWAVISIVLINLVVIVFYDFNGNRRAFAKGWTLVPDFRGMLVKLFGKAKALIPAKK